VLDLKGTIGIAKADSQAASKALGALNFVFLADEDESHCCGNDHNQEASQQAVEEVHQRGSHGCLTLTLKFGDFVINNSIGRLTA
jgi:hypothetical protein